MDTGESVLNSQENAADKSSSQELLGENML